MSETKGDCYSAGERAAMEWSQSLRGRLMDPLLRGMAAAGVHPDQVSVVSLLAGVGFCPFWLYEYYAAAIGCLALHVLLDGLDGPLARHLGIASNRGSFTDTFIDQLVVFIVTTTLMADGRAGVAAGATYLYLYTVVVAFAMIRNALAAPYSWVLRPRFLVYAWLAVEIWLWPGTLDYLLWIFSLVLALKTITGFFAIRRQL